MLTTVGQYDAPVLQKLFLFQQAGSGHSFPQHTDRQTQSVSSAHACGVRNCQSARRQKGNQHLKTTLFNGDFTAELSCLQPSPPRIGAAWSCDTCGLVWICKQKCCTLTSICQTRQIQDVKATATCCNLQPDHLGSTYNVVTMQHLLDSSHFQLHRSGLQQLSQQGTSPKWVPVQCWSISLG